MELWSNKDPQTALWNRSGLNCCFAGVHRVKKKVFDSEVRVTAVNKACEHGPNGACLLGVPGLYLFSVDMYQITPCQEQRLNPDWSLSLFSSSLHFLPSSSLRLSVFLWHCVSVTLTVAFWLTYRLAVSTVRNTNWFASWFWMYSTDNNQCYVTI